MCVKIICSDHEHEYRPDMPLEDQMVNAKEILVNYDPRDPNLNNISSLMDQMERLCKNGISYSVDIKMNANNHLNGIKIERTLEKIKRKLDVNEVVKGLARLHAEVDHRLVELSQICAEKINE